MFGDFAPSRDTHRPRTGPLPKSPFDKYLDRSNVAAAPVRRIDFADGVEPAVRVHPDIDRVLHTERQIQARIEGLAREITERLGHGPLTVVGVLNGAVVFVSDLIRQIDAPIELAFVSASSYRRGTTSGQLELDFLPNSEMIEGRRVLLVDDILDTGRTMAALVQAFSERGAREVHPCVLLDKPSRRRVDVGRAFVGFSIEDAFVVGYGLDFAGQYRNLPYIGVLKPELAAAAV